MCGICGFVGEGDEEVLRRMTRTLRHRGPDDEHVYFDAKRAVGLGFRRLAILDLSERGRQPMCVGNFWIVFNGEVYNYVELREQYLRDEPFVSGTDTEVVLRLYCKKGYDAFALLNGMFAIAIWDGERGELVLVRDRYGKKPLYYGVFGGTLVFGSEVKALLEHPLVGRRLNMRALLHYLVMEYVPTPMCIYDGIYKLEPGSYVVWRGGRLGEPVRFYSLGFSEGKCRERREALSRLDGLLRDAVRIRLRSDVPVGVFLSGGLDSSVVTWYANWLAGNRITTISIAFEERSYDESPYFFRVSEALGIPRHHVDVLTLPAATQIVEELYPLVDEPFADPSLIPTYYLSRLARRSVTVVLGGDGGDELLGGYQPFQVHWWVRHTPLRFVRGWVWRVLEKCFLPLLPVSDRDVSFDFALRQTLRGLQLPHPLHHLYWMGACTVEEAQNLLSTTTIPRSPTPISYSLYRMSEAEGKPWWERVHAWYFRTYLLDDILVKVDRASMYNSLEVRAPFLDWRVVDFVFSLPVGWRWTSLRGKCLLRELMEGRLPADILHRKKKGFGIPLSRWLREGLRQYVEELFALQERNVPFLNWQLVRRWWRVHQERRLNLRKPLWTVIVFLLWVRHWGFDDVAEGN